MTQCFTSRTVDFRLEGQFLGFALGDGYKLKYLRLATDNGEQQIKLAKELRPLLYRSLLPGTPVAVVGSQKWNLVKGLVKRKAYQVLPLVADEGSYSTLRESLGERAISEGRVSEVTVDRSALGEAGVATIAKPLPAPIQPSPEASLEAPPRAKQQKGCILVCGKSDCCKKGGRAVMASLQEELSDRGLEGEVKIKTTGCMKRCKAGPNVVMPDKTRYSKISAKEISGIIHKHFSNG